MEYKICPNCNKKLNGILVTKYIVEPNISEFINSFHSPNSEAYCNDCSGVLISKYKSEITQKKEAILNGILKHINLIPIVTSHSPLGWVYSTIGMVSSQSISGTGLMSELSGSWADFTGGQSNTMAGKISSGEDICRSKLRLQTAQLGGNAILATDIDYSEVGGGKGMLMVCMAGTAISLDIDNDIFNHNKEEIKYMKTKAIELDELSRIRFPNY